MKNRKLTICFLGTAASIHTVKWAEFFAEKGHNIHLVSYDDYINKKSEKIFLHIIGKKIPFQLWRINTIINLPWALLQTKKIFKKIKPDIINAHYVTSYGHLAVLSGFKPLVVTVWGSDILITPKESLITKIVVKYVLKKADLITCDADHMKKAITKLGASENKIEIINFGIDVNRFLPGEKDLELGHKLGVSGSKIIISLRTFEPRYNLETLLRAMVLVLRKYPTVKLIMVGGGSQEGFLKNLVSRLKIDDSVKFVGIVLNDDLPGYLRLADIYVSTSLSDGGIASSTAEAMACGLPVVITDTGDNKKWVKDGEEGFVISTKNAEILAEKIIYLLKNEDICKKLGQSGRKIIMKKNNYYKEMAKMEEIYQNLVKNKKSQ